MLGEVVHNEHVINNLKQKGLKLIKNYNKIPLIKNGILVIQSHGIPQRIYDAQFDLSHLMKVASYMSPILGTGFGVILIYKEQISLAEELQKTRDKLSQEKLYLELFSRKPLPSPKRSR